MGINTRNPDFSWLGTTKAQIIFSDDIINLFSRYTRGEQKFRGKVLSYHIAFIDCNENSQIETTAHSKLTEIKI